MAFGLEFAQPCSTATKHEKNITSCQTTKASSLEKKLKTPSQAGARRTHGCSCPSARSPESTCSTGTPEECYYFTNTPKSGEKQTRTKLVKVEKWSTWQVLSTRHGGSRFMQWTEQFPHTLRTSNKSPRKMAWIQVGAGYDIWENDYWRTLQLSWTENESFHKGFTLYFNLTMNSTK